MIYLSAAAKKFVEKAKKVFEPTRIILFGSRARGDWLKDSDYDFIIVSEEFEGIDFLERIKKVLRECDVEFNAEILCYTPGEFERKRKQIGTVGQAAKEGVVL